MAMTLAVEPTCMTDGPAEAIAVTNLEQSTFPTPLGVAATASHPQQASVMGVTMVYTMHMDNGQEMSTAQEENRVRLTVRNNSYATFHITRYILPPQVRLQTLFLITRPSD